MFTNKTKHTHTSMHTMTKTLEQSFNNMVMLVRRCRDVLALYPCVEKEIGLL